MIRPFTTAVRRTLFRSGAVLALALPLLVGFTGHDDTFDFKASPKIGDVADFREGVAFSISGQDVTVDNMLHQVVDAVSPAGVVQITQTESDVSVKVGGQATQSPEPKPITLTFLPTGELKEAKVEGADGNWYRLFNLSVFLHPDQPVKIGDSWTKTLLANKTTGAVSIKATYNVISKEKVGQWDTVKLTYKVAELGVDTPATGEGTIWVSLADSQVVKQDTMFKNASFPGGAGMQIDGSMKIERVK